MDRDTLKTVPKNTKIKTMSFYIVFKIRFLKVCEQFRMEFPKKLDRDTLK